MVAVVFGVLVGLVTFGVGGLVVFRQTFAKRQVQTRRADYVFNSVMAALVVGVVGLVIFFAVSFGVRQSQESGRRGCTKWAVNTGRDTKYVYQGAGTWVCMTQTGEGEWLPIDQIREVAP